MSDREYAARLAPNIARIRIPDRSNPLNWFTFRKNVAAPWSIFQASVYGWMITFLRVPHGLVSPTVIPNLVPTEAATASTEAISAFVELPESNGVNQYCVTVQKEFGWAQLQTPEWTVLFIEIPVIKP